MKSKGGRPALQPDKKRTGRISIKCTVQDKAVLVRRANNYGINLSCYMLRTALGKRVIINPKEMLKELHEVNLSLARIGNNINQLTHYANIMLKLGHLNDNMAARLRSQLDEYLQQQASIERSFRQIIRNLTAQ